jgi:hypothetical protein
MRAVFLIIVCITAFSVSLNAQGIQIDRDSLIEKAFRFLQEDQKKETKGIEYFKGEWGSYIINTSYLPQFIRKGKKAYDSNCFTTATVHNLLAEIYLTHPEYSMIPEMLDPALQNLTYYYKNGTYNFWHYLPRVEHLQKRRHKKHPERYYQQRPNNFIFRGRFLNHAANVCNDADDSALSLSALFLNHKVNTKKDSAYQSQLPDSVGMIFSKYRNVKRHRIHFYNVFHSDLKKIKGTYCTWFGEEPPMTGFYFLPFMSKQERYIPYNTNEVDCIVNANILMTLKYYDELETPGVKEAIRMLKHDVTTRRCNHCGMYYPTEYNLHYLVSCLIANDYNEFDDVIPDMIERLAKSQKTDGSWDSDIDDNSIQVTLYAVNCLLNISEVEKYGTLPMIEKGVSYILSQAKVTDHEAHWKGGVFFSAGTVMRKTFVWKSDAVTTALAVTALVKYDDLVRRYVVK